MRYLLSAANVEVLAQVASTRVLVAFDFDGTLAPIVADRDRAAMRRRTEALLAKVCARYPCAVISGRSRRDVSARLGAARVKYVVGNHGLEPGTPGAGVERYADVVARILPPLEGLLSGVEGIDVEDKRYSIAVHYRRCRRRGAARAAIRGAAARLPEPVRLVSGKLVLNLVPRDAPNKGDALLKLRAEEGADTALYVGDDVTDEDVFSLDEPGRLLAVRVGASKSSSAPFFIRHQREIDPLLRALLFTQAKDPTLP